MYPGGVKNGLLYGLVSAYAGSELRTQVLANPSLIGGVAQVRLLFSDFADLYYKGQIAAQEEYKGRGIASPIGVNGEVRVFSTANDFSHILATIKQQLRQRGAKALAAAGGKDIALAQVNTSLQPYN